MELHSQQGQARIEFSQKEYNYGIIRESEGIQSFGFTYISTGNQPLYIIEIKSTCGCTNSEFSSEPVLPGERGTLLINFDPKGKEGAFSEMIQVFTNVGTQPINIIVRGVVIPVSTREEVYKYSFDDLLLEDIYISFGEVYKGNEALKQIRIYNSSDINSLTPAFTEVGPHLRLELRPSVLEPLQEGILNVYYDSRLLEDWDFVIDRINISPDYRIPVKGVLSITANIKEDFSKLTSGDLISAPVADFDNTTYNFGAINQEDIITHHFTLSNKGKRDLLIRKITASCGCTAVNPGILIVPPGESTKITAVFNPVGQGGAQRKAITVITNDPKRSRTILWIEGNVEMQSP